MNIYFGANKTLVKVIKEGAFGGIYFRNVSSGVNSKRYRKSCKEFEELKILIGIIIAQIVVLLVLILNVEHH